MRLHQRGRSERASPGVRRGIGGRRPLPPRRSGLHQGGGARGGARAGTPHLGCSRGALPFEPGGVRDRHHAAPARPGGAGGGVPARAGYHGGSAPAPPRGPGAYRSRAALDPVARRAHARRGAAPGRAGLRGRRARPARLPPRQPARWAGLPPERVRLFVALNLPPAVREALWAATAALRELGLPVNWVRGDGIHLTLKFLGEVVDDREAEITAALGRAAAGARTLPLALAGFGVFPDFRRPRVVWAGIAPEPGLEILQHHEIGRASCRERVYSG